MSLSPLRQFVLAAALWLPAAFFLWALLAGPVVWPLARIAAAVLPWLLADVIAEVSQLGPQLEVVTRLQTAAAGDRIGVLVLSVNPLIYAWCLALFVGLVMATPLEGRQRLRQLLIGLPVLWLVCAWGCVFEVLKLLSFDAGPLGAAAIARAGFAADAVALGYQFGYLILPAVTPIALWVVQNREFLEQLVGWRGEPAVSAQGQTGSAQAADAPKDPP